MSHEAHSAMVQFLVGTAYNYLHGHKEIPFKEIHKDLEALITAGLNSQPWFVSVHSMYHIVDGLEYYDIGIMTKGAPIAVRAVLQPDGFKTSLH